MIYCLTGELLYLNATTMSAVVDCGGVGYKLTASGNAITMLSSAGEGSKVRVFTYMSVREDAVDLFGFANEEELDIFKLLISVSGVGPKAAISILSVMSAQDLINTVVAEDAKAISRAPGVGAKTAARIVLELHDKVEKNFFVSAPQSPAAKGTTSKGAKVSGHLSDARDALLVLGYSRGEVANALTGMDPKMDTEEIIRLCLAKLMK
ncbi:MAG: Holliday junction branch migration protein RuvA [Ruminococcaceae bacterium]|nr:Holliday junction branch migration protein RuvA [Oscillospiraceae bacterium]